MINQKQIKIIFFSGVFIILVLLIGIIFLYLSYKDCDYKTGKESYQKQEAEVIWGKRIVPFEFGVFGGVEEFDCPSWMKYIYWDNEGRDFNTRKLHFYNSEDNEIQRAYMSTKTGRIVFITNEQEYDERGENIKQKSYLKIIKPDIRRVENIYEATIKISLEVFSDIQFSPDGRYVSFIVWGYEWADIMVLDLNSGKNILEDKNIYCGLEDMVWSEDGRYLIINNGIATIDGSGSESVLLMDLQNNTSVKVFEIYGEMAFWGDEFIDELAIDHEGENIYFSVVTKNKNGTDKLDYQYNISTQKLFSR